MSWDSRDPNGTSSAQLSISGFLALAKATTAPAAAVTDFQSYFWHSSGALLFASLDRVQMTAGIGSARLPAFHLSSLWISPSPHCLSSKPCSQALCCALAVTLLFSSACGRSWASRAGGSRCCAPSAWCACWSWCASCQPCNASSSSSWRPWTTWPPSACCWCSSSSSLGECFRFSEVFGWDAVVGWGDGRVVPGLEQQGWFAALNSLS